MTRFAGGRQRRRIAALGLVAWLVAVPIPAKEAFTSILARTAGAPGAALTRVSITVETYTTDADAAALLQAAQSGGPEAVVSALRRLDRGFVSVNGVRRSRINAARTVASGTHRRIVIVCAGALFSAVSPAPPLSAEDVFHVLELDMDDRGQGTGQLIEAATVRLDGRGFVDADRQLGSSQLLVEVQPCTDKC